MKLTQEEVQKLKADIQEGDDIEKCKALGNGDMICSMARRCKTKMNLIDTIEAQQQEIDRLYRWVSDLQRGVYVNCVYCGHRYGPEDEVPTSMADALKEHIEHCPEHPMSKLKQEFAQLQEQLKYAEGAMEIEAFDARQLRQNVELLKAQNTIMSEALRQVQHDVDSAECRDDLDGIKGFIDDSLSSDAGKDYHNPADVEVLKQMREGLNKISEEALFSSFGDEICMVCPWTEKSHLPESLCEGCSCTEALEKWKEEM